MAADVLSRHGARVTLFDKRKSAGRKLLVAGSSGLNITNSLPLEEFVQHYRGGTREFWLRVIGSFTPSDWIAFIEDLGFKTFEGTSRRHFIEEMKASRFLQAWITRLSVQGVTFSLGQECTDFAIDTTGDRSAGLPQLRFADGSQRNFDAVLFALGGASWEPQETPLRWPPIFRSKQLRFDEFQPSNVGYRVAWSAGMIEEADGKPLKTIRMRTALGERAGDAMITRYGIEGTPVYFVGTAGTALMDLKPDLSEAQLLKKLQSVKENLSPIRRVQKTLSLSPAAQALVFHHAPRERLGDDLSKWAALMKAFPLELLGPQPLTEAISSSGGLSLEELDDQFMLKRFPGIYCAGEMLNWDVPTGGFLIQACVAQGMLAARGILKRG